MILHSLLHELTGYEIVVEQYREYSTDSMTSFIFHAVDNGNIIDFDEFLTGSLENELFVRLEQCRILRIQVCKEISPQQFSYLCANCSLLVT